MMIESVTAKNFRCFREIHSVKLAPLTLLVGENGTGKTSFLALLRALWDVAFQGVTPDFREPPYELGCFGDIVHHRGVGKDAADSFEAGFWYEHTPADLDQIYFHVTFKERNSAPYPVSRSLEGLRALLKTDIAEDGGHTLLFSTDAGQWECSSPAPTGDDAQPTGFLDLLMASPPQAGSRGRKTDTRTVRRDGRISVGVRVGR